MTSTVTSQHARGTSSAIVRMANQIAIALLTTPDPEAATAEHIASFWDPRMRAQLRAVLATGGEELHPVARAAARRLETAL